MYHDPTNNTLVKAIGDAQARWRDLSPVDRFAMANLSPRIFGPWERGVIGDGSPDDYWIRRLARSRDHILIEHRSGIWVWKVVYGDGHMENRGPRAGSPTFARAAELGEAFWRSKEERPDGAPRVEFVGGLPEDMTLYRAFPADGTRPSE